MHTLKAVLQFIHLNEMTIEDFEISARLRCGAVTDAYEQSRELRNIEVNKIIARFGRQFYDLGFAVCPIHEWPGYHNDYIILERDLNRMFFGNMV